jgi:uncharacterized membrane-anchored protein YhcB (DUF1043 family)
MMTAEQMERHFKSSIEIEKELQAKIKELEEQLEKATTMIVNHEAKMGFMKEALEKIRDDRSPQWDKTDFQRIARECLGMLFK